MKKRMIFLLIIIFLITGCIESNSVKTYYLALHIENNSNQTYDVNISIENSNSLIIFNSNITLLPDETRFWKEITSIEDNYTLNLFLDDGRNLTINDLNPNTYKRWPKISFNETDIWYSITQK